MRYITIDNLAKLLENLKKDYLVFAPVKKGQQRFYKEYSGAIDEVVVSEVRAFEPLKSFFYRARQIVAEGFKPDVPHSKDKPFCIVGVKACDLKGFKIQDYVFENHDYHDPLYIKSRQDNLIISADCTCVLDTCFCQALGLRPFPQGDFDINLSSINDGFVVETGSPKGEALIEKNSSLFEEAKGEAISTRDRQREKVKGEVEGNLKESGVPHQDIYKGIIEKNYESDIWSDESASCVECGACNTICPTCHCFLLYDQKDEDRMARLRIWDSCMIKDFAMVAGGANPRERLWMRLRNRFEKKFDFFPKVAEVYACTGCGRCISACPAKIDIRKVLKRLANNA